MGLKENIKEHLKNNRGKYAFGAGLGLPAAGIKLGSTGYLGTDVQDSIQNVGGTLARNLNASAQYDKVKGDLDAGIGVYKKGDNILYNPSEENEKLLTVDRIIQKENIPYLAKKAAANVSEYLSSTKDNPDKINYIIRNPLKELEYRKDLTRNSIDGAVDSVTDSF